MEAQAWYRERSDVAAQALALEINEAIKRIAEAPERWQKTSRGEHRFVLSRFPYSIMYRIRSDDVFIQEEWRRLEADLRSQHLTKEARPVVTSRYGQKYEVRAALVGSAGRSAQVVSAWVVLAGDDVPRFVTAYPGGKL